MSTQQEQPECCPPFNPAPWDGQIVEWNNKMFVKDKVCTLFYMPMNFGSVMVRLSKAMTANGASCPDWLCLSDHTSMWKMDVYLAVDKEIPGLNNVTLSGKFLCKVYEGPFKDTGKWCKDFAEYAKSKGHAYTKMFMWYTTCPKCAKKYGKNYVVIVAKVD